MIARADVLRDHPGYNFKYLWKNRRAMAPCTVCGEETGSLNRCSHCNEPVCGDHRLPENHDCLGRYKPSKGEQESSGSSVEAPGPMDLSGRTTGSAPDTEPPTESGAPVETKPPDESRPSPEAGANSDDTSETGTPRTRTGGIARLAVTAIGVGLVLLAGYNALLAPYADLSVWAPYRITNTVVVRAGGAVHADDAVLAGLGAALAWFS